MYWCKSEHYNTELMKNKQIHNINQFNGLEK